MFTDEFFMKEALKEADKALIMNEVPIGAVIVSNNKIIARGHNLSETLNDSTAHAEMQAFTAASEHIGAKYLNECTLYVTLEPCIMCAGAAYWTQIGKIVYGAKDFKKGYNTLNTNILHPKTEVISGILENECSKIISDFFKTKR
ncbi:MAG: nucleoside deaminase [Bacteroidales bacterium]|nr:nucleoside deaminase [Bacteroidales bacterium]MBN2758659.1 nucleoside deaminase [Bacteroidales bacterium]